MKRVEACAGVAVLALLLWGCPEKKKEGRLEEMGEKLDQAGETLEEATEEAGDALEDAADKVEDAVDP